MNGGLQAHLADPLEAAHMPGVDVALADSGENRSSSQTCSSESSSLAAGGLGR